ncbi:MULTISPECIES: sporulation histidine kinase inhibitor Sda [Shouchella]|jgi:developmental checkpoint coupling sporulation initiation to replication initiation|nr:MULTISPECIES: sporulation histidine kinase inhibitor Sda [Shouchella]AST96344.1 hypothetical protein BC8716_10465 [Shouchella clausii]WQG94445.1 sporulation histidine kinase inhibitor Sda [Shouchella clausii]GIN12412.1 hypothetical protein J26TS2_22790 [Shouchella clausii]
MLKDLSDDLLLHSYYQAIEHQLSVDFIVILKNELFRRGMLHTTGQNT